MDRENRFEPTTNPLTTKIIIGYAAENGIGKHSAAGDLLEEKIKEMPQSIKDKYLKTYNSLPPERRKNPKI